LKVNAVIEEIHEELLCIQIKKKEDTTGKVSFVFYTSFLSYDSCIYEICA